MTPIQALQILAQAQAVAPLTEADRNAVYEALKTLRPLVVEVDPTATPTPHAPPPGPGPVAPNPPIPPSQ